VDGVRQRFESKVDRSGEHYLWRGACKADGTGMFKLAGRAVTARRVAWELEHGPLPAEARVERCPTDAGCVRVDHLAVAERGGAASTTDAESHALPATKPNGRRAAGSMRKTDAGSWELSVTAGRYDDGTIRREFRTVHVPSERAAARALATFVVEVQSNALPSRRQDRSVTVDAAVEQFLNEYLLEEKGREPKTVNDYRLLHAKWFSPEIGGKLLRSIDEATVDRLFGRMARAGLSRSRMNQAKSLYGPFFRWARSRRLVNRNPMADFQLPTARKPSHERIPPEIEELILLLRTAAEIVPEIAPVLALGAVTGMRRGELLGLRRSRLQPDTGRILVDAAIDEGRRVKTTKTRRDRTFHVDAETMAVLQLHCREMDDRAATTDVHLVGDPFVFSNSPDCSEPMPPDYVTRRVAVVKEHLGIADKRPETIAAENEALRLFRQRPAARAAGRTGPAPKGGMSLGEIGRQLGRSDRWAAAAIASAQRREEAASNGLSHSFDGSILALRKFTSTELLDAGFNISMVAQRQGHGPGVLVKHYAKARQSADRKAADHLGRVIHGTRGDTPSTSGPSTPSSTT
jgi:integrase